MKIMSFILALIALVLVVHLEMTRPKAAQSEPVYERVMRDRTIRCAYQTWPPYLVKDPNTSKITGIYVDLFNQIGRDLNLKIEFVEEVGAVNMFEGFVSGRYDMLCSPITSTPERALVSGFSRAIGYVPFYLYARDGDTRFDHAYEKANNEDVSMIYMEGDFAAAVENEVFPKAKKTSLPNMTNGADVLMNLAGNKADLAVNDPTIGDLFIKTNPHKVRRVLGPPLRFPSLNIALPLGEDRLRELMDQTITNYLEVGKIDQILNKYGLDETKILRVALPYVEPATTSKVSQ